MLSLNSVLLVQADFLGPIYTKRPRQRWDNSAMMLAILFSLKTMESLENGLQPHSGATPLFSMRTVLLALSQRCCIIDADARCKWALTRKLQPMLTNSIYIWH